MTNHINQSEDQHPIELNNHHPSFVYTQSTLPKYHPLVEERLNKEFPKRAIKSKEEEIWDLAVEETIKAMRLHFGIVPSDKPFVKPLFNEFVTTKSNKE